MFGVFPFIPPLTTVPFEDVDEFEDKEDEELDRCALLRGMNMALTSSFMELSDEEPLELHPERVCGGWKLGGLATAVIGELGEWAVCSDDDGYVEVSWCRVPVVVPRLAEPARGWKGR